MMRKVVVEQVRIINDGYPVLSPHHQWYTVSSTMFDADEVPTRVLIDGEIVWETTSHER